MLSGFALFEVCRDYAGEPIRKAILPGVDGGWALSTTWTSTADRLEGKISLKNLVLDETLMPAGYVRVEIGEVSVIVKASALLQAATELKKC